MGRERLSNRRRGETFEFKFSGINITATVGYYQDGRAGEVFLKAHKTGTELDVVCRDSGILLSLLLQYGCPLEEVHHALSPDGVAGLGITALRKRPFLIE